MTGVRSGTLHEFQEVLGPLHLHYGRFLLANDLALYRVLHTQTHTHTHRRARLRCYLYLNESFELVKFVKLRSYLGRCCRFLLFALCALYCQRLEQVPWLAQANSIRRRCLSNKYPSQSFETVLKLHMDYVFKLLPSLV